MSEQCEAIKKDLDNFKDAYVKNNKEFLQLTFTVGELRDALKDHIIEMKEYRISREKNDDDWKELIEKKLEPLSTGYKSIKWLFAVLMGIGGLILLAKNLLK